jgi:sugar phosphate isomerase/epimerase
LIDKVYAAPKYISLEQGIEFVMQQNTCYEIPSFLAPQNLDNKSDEISRYRELLKDFKGTLSLHGPIYDMNPVSLDPRIADSSRHRYIQAVEVCKELGVKYLVFHSQYTPIFDVANVYKEWLAQSTDFWQEVIETHLQGTDMVLLMENFMDSTPDIINSLIDRVDSPHMKICLDTGHVNLFSKVSPIDWLDEFGSNVEYIHAHNNHGEKDEHYAFQKGTIDMEGFLNHLVLLPHKVNLAIEVFNIEGVQESFDMIQNYMKMQSEQLTSKSFLL